MRKLKTLFLLVALAAFVSGCSSVRTNLAYRPAGVPAKVGATVKGVLTPVVDLREDTKAYPKQVIVHTGYRGGVTYDINDRTVDEVFEDALSAELQAVGIKLVRAETVSAPLDGETAGKLRHELATLYPDVQVAFGAKVMEFMARSKRELLTDKVRVSAWVKFYVLDVKTGDLLWSDYKTEWDSTFATMDREKMIKQLNEALTSLMHKAVRDNGSLRDLLTKVSTR